MIVEQDRVRQHIFRAEAVAAGRDISHLGRAQRLVRELLLAALSDYRATGRFPLNRDFADQTPYFIDAGGTRCAMAHLLELGGEHDLVARIARERNNAYVRELADEPRLLAWLAAAGLTVAEAAAIQPAYCAETAACVCGDTEFSQVQYPVPAAGVLELTVIGPGSARVDHTFGNTFGVAAGAAVEVASFHPVGARLLAPIDAAPSAAGFATVQLDTAGAYACHSQGVGDAPILSPDEFASAVMATDCPGALKAMDGGWEGNSCDGDGGGIDVTPGAGCSTGGGAEALSVGILLALVAGLARR